VKPTKVRNQKARRYVSKTRRRAVTALPTLVSNQLDLAMKNQTVIQKEALVVTEKIG
jgi:hypothetical protein